MCGIIGAVTNNGGLLPGRDIAEQMCSVIAHRGPDDQGIYYTNNAFIGMRRLSIIDMDTGHQPIHNEDETIWVVFNGEIYNFKELRKRLEERGHKFYTSSDSECIVHCYEEYGERCFEHLLGMFAIAIWDSINNILLLGRDRLGKKPLYYAPLKDTLIFGSELKSLLLVPGMARDVSHRSVHDFLIFGYVPADATIFENIYKLPAGHYLIYENGLIGIRSYWQLEFAPKWTDPPAILERSLFDLLDDAVRLRLVSDVPFGAFLSGGIDSSVVVALMAKNMNMPVKTFTIGFKEAQYNEMDDARIVAQHFHTEHHEFIVGADAVSLLEDLVWYFDEPFADSSAIPTYLVSKMASQHVKMVLSGDGGDEAFAGYERYRKYLIIDVLRSFSPKVAFHVLNLLGYAMPKGLKSRLRWVGERVRMPYPDDYLSAVILTKPRLVQELLGDTSLNNTPYGAITGYFRDERILNRIDAMLAGDIKSYLVDDILVKVDRMSMANSLEVRAPLLDHKLMEFAARLPNSLKLRYGSGKYLLKRMARQILPASILKKRKHGFAIPLSEWFRSCLKDLMWDVLESRSFIERGFFNRSIARRCMERHVAGVEDHGEHLWLLLTFELWARRFLDQRVGFSNIESSY
jgi:asparagine synthase (glutamine-hydrolysing)